MNNVVEKFRSYNYDEKTNLKTTIRMLVGEKISNVELTPDKKGIIIYGKSRSSEKGESKIILNTGEAITLVNVINDGAELEFFSIPSNEEKEVKIKYEEICKTEETIEEEINKVAEKKEEVTKKEEHKQKEVKLEEKGSVEYLEKYFPIVKVSSIKRMDRFLMHIPRNRIQRQIKKMILKAKRKQMADFRAQRIDPSFDEKGNICYKEGMNPAVGESVEWWEKNAKEFLPEKESELGLKEQRAVWLGLIIKYLVEKKGYSVNAAWKAVCNDSKNLAHFSDSEDGKEYFENTGSRPMGEWCDLGNTAKYTVDRRKSKFLLFSGSFHCMGKSYPLATIFEVVYKRYKYKDALGWIVLNKV